jgi:integrase
MSEMGHEPPSHDIISTLKGSDVVGGVAEGTVMESDVPRTRHPWNKGILVGQKRPLQPKNVWSIRVRLEMSGATRELALFNLAIDSKLRACDLVRLRVEDLWSGSAIRDRATIVQKKTKRPVQFEVTEQTKVALAAWLPSVKRTGGSYLFPGRRRQSTHLSTRQYARIVQRWVRSIGLETSAYGTHSMRRTKAALIYKKTGNLRAVQILLGHTKLESTVRYLGIEIDDALRIAEQIEL